MRSDDVTTQYLRNVQSRGEEEALQAEAITESSNPKNAYTWSDQADALETAKPAGQLHEEGKLITKTFIRQSFE